MELWKTLQKSTSQEVILHRFFSSLCAGLHFSLARALVHVTREFSLFMTWFFFFGPGSSTYLIVFFFLRAQYFWSWLTQLEIIVCLKWPTVCHWVYRIRYCRIYNCFVYNFPLDESIRLQIAHFQNSRRPSMKDFDQKALFASGSWFYEFSVILVFWSIRAISLLSGSNSYIFQELMH